jgi:DNA-binding CsgD family transcriptional regulator
MILEVIQPHLSNFYAMHKLLATYDAQLPDAATLASEYKTLTRREAEIAALICRWFSTGMIALKFLISPATVYRHITNIFTKLEVFNRDELLEKLLSDYSGGKIEDR